MGDRQDPGIITMKPESGNNDAAGAESASDVDSRLDDLEHKSMLYDFYGALLNDNQNEVMSLYHEDNLSLSEIAEQLGMTRQAVHYTLKKAERALEGYEERLGLIGSFSRNQELAARAEELIGELAAEDDPRRAELTRIISELSE